MRLGLLAMVLGAIGLLGCGTAEDSQTRTQDFLARGCSNPPVERFMLSPDPVPNSWIIVFVNDTPVRATGDALARQYGGTVTHYFEFLGGIGLAVGEDAARQISNDPVVCYVEQNGYAYGP